MDRGDTRKRDPKNGELKVYNTFEVCDRKLRSPVILTSKDEVKIDRTWFTSYLVETFLVIYVTKIDYTKE